jgi:hypothetical protein
MIGIADTSSVCGVSLEGADAALQNHFIVPARDVFGGSNNSSSVAAIPRLSRTGFLLCPVRKIEVLHCARALLKMSMWGDGPNLRNFPR